MNRFFGIMPADEVEITKYFKDANDLTIRIEAGPNGWTIIWADHSTNYSDVLDTSENNFAKAFDTAVGIIGPLRFLNGWRKKNDI